MTKPALRLMPMIFELDDVGQDASPATLFLERTDRWLEEVRVDFLARIGEPFAGDASVLFAADVLLALHGDAACWSLLEPAAVERFVQARARSLAPHVPAMLCDLAAFAAFLARRGRVPEHVAGAFARRVFDLVTRWT